MFQQVLRRIFFRRKDRQVSRVCKNGAEKYQSFSSLPIEKVLVANRGEIACRVLRTCGRLGIRTVALYSIADGPGCLHAGMADESYLIGTGPSPAESYLVQSEVLRVAKETGAQAIHPGYGFLSENASFAAKVSQSSIQFIGPPSSAITAMGSKSTSKAIMDKAGVPTTPGYYGDDNQDANFLLHKAVTEVGFPLLVKAVMGGGGKGMRLVWEESEFKEALESCQRESQAAFGDSAVLLEKYLVRPRHVEVQVIGDKHGNYLHLYERDCSLQRRHQKIIEEAPASDLDQEIRQRLGTMGTKAAEAVGYVNAGTVEFLLDTKQPDKFYFCEMNTRLQVEHPVTELITGIDLVEWQLRIAAGEQLPIQRQKDVPCQGHALEARIYAENPARDFLPATGKLLHHRPPVETPNTGAVDGVRVDTGVEAGQDVGVYYDPMISKLIVHGSNRESAVEKLVTSLRNYHIAGVPTNIAFLINCAKHPTFSRAGAVNTGFLEDFADDVRIKDDTEQPIPLARAIGALAALLYLENRIGIKSTKQHHQQQRSNSPWSSLSGSWRMGGRAKGTIYLQDGGSNVEYYCNRDGSYDIKVRTDETAHPVCFHVIGFLDDKFNMEVLVDGTKRIRLSTVLVNDDCGNHIQVNMWPDTGDYYWQVNFENPLFPPSVEKGVAALSSSSLQGTVKTPMPGKVTQINHCIGDHVKAGDLVMVLEAMKMEHPIKSPRDGILAELRYDVNDIVADRTVLFIVEDEEDGSGDVTHNLKINRASFFSSV